MSLTALSLQVSAQESVAEESESESEIDALEEFVVFGAAQEGAITRQENSDIIANFLDSDAIGSLPDDTLGEALTRLPGVNVVFGQVTIRGAEGKLNAVRVNGLRLPNGTSGDTRNFNVNSIPSEMVDSVSVIKTITAEYDADSIGGIINVETPSGFSYGEQLIRYKAEYRYHEQESGVGFGLNLAYADILGDSDKVGIFLNVTYREEDTSPWRAEYRQANAPTPGAIPLFDRFDPRDHDTHSETLGINASIDWKISDNTTLFVRPWIQSADTNDFRYRVRSERLSRQEGNWWFVDASGNPMGEWEDTDGDGTLGSEGDAFIQARDGNGDLLTSLVKESTGLRIRRRSQVNPFQSDTYQVEVGGKTTGDVWTFDYRVQWGENKGDRKGGTQVTFDTPGSQRSFLRFRYDYHDPIFPEITAWRVTQKGGHIQESGAISPYEDNDLVLLQRIRSQDDTFVEETIVGQFDATGKVGKNLTLKAGFKLRNADRAVARSTIDWGPEIDVPQSVFSADFGPNLEIFDGRYSHHGPILRDEPVFEFFEQDLAANPSNWELSDVDPVTVARTYSIEETILAGYVQGTFQFGEDMTVVAGVRVEDTDVNSVWEVSKFNEQFTSIPDLGSRINDIAETNSYTNWFPSIVASYRFGDSGHVIRAAYTTTIARPDFNDIVPFDIGLMKQAFGDTISGLGDNVAFGNPELVEQTADNLDIGWEYYFGKNGRGLVSVNYFYKDLKDFLMNNSFDRTLLVPSDPLDLASPLVDEEFRTSFVVNGSSQKLKGVEVTFSGTLNDILPRPFDGFGWMATYTRTSGEETIPVFDPAELANGNFVETDSSTSSGLSNQPENLLSLQGFYDSERLSVRLAYNYIDQFKINTFDVAFVTFRQERKTLDLAVQVRPFKNRDMRLFMDASNLTKEVANYTFQERSDFPESYDFEDGIRWVFGLRGSF